MKKHMKRFFQYFGQDVSIRNRMIISNVILIFIPLLFVTFLSFGKSSQMLEQNMNVIMQKGLDQTAITLNNQFESSMRVLDNLLNNPLVNDSLKRAMGQYSFNQQIEDSKALANLFAGYQNENSIYRIRLFLNSEDMLSKEHNNFFGMKEIENTNMYKRFSDNPTGLHWEPTHTVKYAGVDAERSVMTISRAVFDFRASEHLLGIVAVDILESNIHYALNESQSASTGLVYILDSRGQMISGSNEIAYGEAFKEQNEKLSEINTNSGWHKAVIDKQDYLVGYHRLEYSGWLLVSVTPMSHILKPVIQLRDYSIFTMVIIGIIAYTLSYLISLTITNRIGKLNKTTKRVKSGDLQVQVQTGAKDEIGELEDNFQNMLYRLSVLMEQQYKLGQDLKAAELKTLQAQINPHFLYNTLDLLNWQASKYKAQDIKSLVRALATFYKLCLSKGSDFIAIADELTHVETYVQIQNYRFNDRIALVVDVPENIVEVKMLKLLLQPIIENAILHGIMEKESKTGTIVITAYLDGKDIVFKIEDDGVGMDEQTAVHIIEGSDRPGGHGYGVKNVHERVKIFYGEGYGVSYQSKLGEGTTVTLRIKKQDQ